MERQDRIEPAGVVPNYESFVLLNINGIVDSMNRFRWNEALQKTENFYLALPSPVKEALEDSYIKIEVYKEIASQQKGITAFQTFWKIHNSMKIVANLFVNDFLDKIVRELYTRGYIERGFGIQTKKRDLKDQLGI